MSCCVFSHLLCEPQEIRAYVCLPICVSFQVCEPSKTSEGHNVTHVCAYCLMCGFSFSLLLKLMALRLVYLPRQHVFSVILMFCFYYDSL